jgi:hypothetical protein
MGRIAGIYVSVIILQEMQKGEATWMLILTRTAGNAGQPLTQDSIEPWQIRYDMTPHSATRFPGLNQ